MACVLFAVTVDRAGGAADGHHLVPGLTGVKSVWCDIVLALQLQFSLEVRSLCFGLVSASPERPCDDASGLDAALRELEGDTTDFLDRPADQERRLIDRRGNVFLGPIAAALAR
jgi:hypothetical protein